MQHLLTPLVENIYAVAFRLGLLSLDADDPLHTLVAHIAS